jgi:glutathione S-transferase
MDYMKIDISNKESENSLIQIGGKRQVPFLVDTDRNIQMYESNDIIEYLKTVC